MATYHIKKTGNDGNVGSEVSPWLTIKASIPKLSANDTLEIWVGTYVESVVIGSFGGNAWPQGSAGNIITIKAHGSTETTTKGVSAGTDAVVIQPSGGHCFGFNTTNLGYYRIEGLVMDGVNGGSVAAGMSFNNGANNFIVSNCEIKNIPDDGLEGASSGSWTTDRNMLFQYLYIHNCGTLHTSPGKHGVYWRSRNAIFHACDISNCDVSCIQFYNSGTSVKYAHNCIVRYCILRDNQTDYLFQQVGLAVGPNMDNLKIHNNLIYAHRDAGIDFATESGGNTGTLIYNNTIVDIGNSGGNGRNGIRATFTGHTGCKVKNNLIWDTVGSSIVDTYGLFETANNWTATSNPNFTGYTRGSAWDLTLSGSTPETILTGGLDLGSEYYDDFAGVTRAGTFSIGAYASGVAPDPPEDPVLIFPAPFLVTINTSKHLDGFGIADINDPDVGDYTFDAAVTEGSLNDGV